MSDFTEDDVENIAIALMAVEIDWVHGRPVKLSEMLGYAELEKIARTVIAAVAPAIAARALRELMDRLHQMDEAGEFGECCANPDCRACSVLQHVAGVAR